jgi:cytochrome b involved in lipid metabolism
MRRVLLLLRKSAWFLLLASVLALFSGFMLGVNLFDYNAAYFIHTVVAPLLFVALLYLHSVAAIIFLSKRVRRLDNEGFRITASSAWTAVFTVFIALYLLQIMPGSLTAPAPLPQTTGQAITQTTSFLDTGVAAGSTTTQAHTSSAQTQRTQILVTDSNTGSPQNTLTLSVDEVGKHNRADDCWIIIAGRVYDVTRYLPLHPDGPDSIIPYCGTDATAAFNTKGGIGKPHSPKANNLLARYYLGDLNSKITLNSPTSTVTGSTTTQTHTSSVQPQPLSTEQIRQIILQRFPDAQILKIKLEKNGSYEAKILVNAQTYELKITSAGEIVKIESED